MKEFDPNNVDHLFQFDGKQWTVSLYTTKDIDCSKIAIKFGGGGHKKAAGFQLNNNEMIENIISKIRKE